MRSPEEMLSLAPVEGVAGTAIHFAKEAPPDEAIETEDASKAMQSMEGAFVAVRWQKPGE